MLSSLQISSRLLSKRAVATIISSSRRHFSFTFAGARKLQDIIKKERFEGKTAAQVSDIWYTYHEERENVHGIILSGQSGITIKERARTCPFFVQPIFRDDGFFMLLSQFLSEYDVFMLAYLEDYKMDPAAAQPLVTCSVFTDYADTLDLTLVRCDIINKGIYDSEGYQVTNCLLSSYQNDDEYEAVKAFNGKQDAFDVDDYVAIQKQKWKQDQAGDE